MFEANPTIKRLAQSRSLEGGLSYNGVINRTGVLLLVTGATFVLTWRGLESGALSPSIGMIGLIVGLVLALIISFMRLTNPLLIGAYAVAEGAALGTISYYVDQRFAGIALQAVGATMGCFLVVLALYSLRVLRATPLLTKIIVGALFGILALYAVDLVAGWMGHPLAMVNGNSGLSVGISVVIVAIASISFVLDFAAIEQAVANGADERDGWLFAFSLLVGLVWLYIEMLRLLMKLRSRD